MTEQVTIDLDDEIIFHLPDPEAAAILREEISVDLIFDAFAREVFTWQMAHYHDHRQFATAVVLEDQFDGFDETPVLELQEPVTAIGDLVIRLRERFVRYEGKKVTNQLADLVVKEPMNVANRMMVEGSRLARLASSPGEVYGTGDFPRARDAYYKRLEEKQGASTGYHEIDEHFGYMKGLTYCVATRKSYKSWITIRSLIENVIQGKKCYLYCLELPALESYWRCACMAANIPYWKYDKKAIMPSDMKELEEAIEALDSTGLFYHQKPAPGQRGVQWMMEHALDKGAEVVYIDQLQYIENKKGYSVGSQNDTGVYWEVCNDLRDYSDQVPLWIVHQFNRSVMHNKDEFPDSQQGKGSSAIEETATLELGLWANAEMRKAHVLQFGTLESRNHAKEHWNLSVNLDDECEFEMIGVVDNDD